MNTASGPQRTTWPHEVSLLKNTTDVFSLEKRYDWLYLKSTLVCALSKGRPTIYWEVAISLMKRAGYKIKWVEVSDSKVVVEVSKNGETHTETYTIEQAKKANLVKPSSPWTLYPENMLRHKALANARRFFCPEVLSGTYTAEEFGETPDTMNAQTINEGDTVEAIIDLDDFEADTEPSPEQTSIEDAKTDAKDKKSEPKPKKKDTEKSSSYFSLCQKMTTLKKIGDTSPQVSSKTSSSHPEHYYLKYIKEVETDAPQKRAMASRHPLWRSLQSLEKGLPQQVLHVRQSEESRPHRWVRETRHRNWKKRYGRGTTRKVLKGSKSWPNQSYRVRTNKPSLNGIRSHETATLGYLKQVRVSKRADSGLQRKAQAQVNPRPGTAKTKSWYETSKPQATSRNSNTKRRSILGMTSLWPSTTSSYSSPQKESCEVIFDVVQSTYPYPSETIKMPVEKLALVANGTIKPALDQLIERMDLWEETKDEWVWLQAPADRSDLYGLDTYSKAHTAIQTEFSTL